MKKYTFYATDKLIRLIWSGIRTFLERGFIGCFILALSVAS